MTVADVDSYDPEATSLFGVNHLEPLVSGSVGLQWDSSEPLRVGLRAEPLGNVLVLGRSPQLGLGLLTIFMLDVAAQWARRATGSSRIMAPQFGIVDYLRNAESSRFSEAALSLSLPVKLEAESDFASTAIADFENASRQSGVVEINAPPRLLFICSLQAAHNLRQTGCYGLPGQSRTAEQFKQLLDNGPVRNLHTIVWCNTVQNLRLTLANGLGSFRTIILLDNPGVEPWQLVEAQSALSEAACCVDVISHRVIAFRPFALPSERWCRRAIGEVGKHLFGTGHDLSGGAR